MENKQFRLKRIRSQIRRLLPIVFLMFSLCLVVLWKTQNPVVVAVRHEVADFLSPVGYVLSAPARWVKSVKDGFHRRAFLSHRNQVLEEENKMLKRWRLLALQLQSEQDAIKKMVNYVPYPTAVSKVARLVLDTGDKFSRNYIALAGVKDGISVGAVALTENGLFARVIEVGDHGARLMLLTDYLSRVPVMVGEKRVPAILSGDNSLKPKLIFVEKDADIKENDLVLTSGQVGVYPSGLAVGVVAAVKQGDIYVDLFESGEGLEFVRLVDFGLSDVLLKTECQE